MNVALSRIAVVAGDAAVAELVCAHFRAPRVYVVLIEAPKIRLEEYGVFENDCIVVTNAIKAHHPQLVLLVSCLDKVAEMIRAHLPPIDAIEINHFDVSELSRLVGFRNHSVTVEMSYLQARRRRHIVAVERDDAMSLVIARNLAAASGADVLLLPAVDEGKVDVIREQLRTWANEAGLAKEEAKESVLTFIRAQLGPLSTAAEASATLSGCSVD